MSVRKAIRARIRARAFSSPAVLFRWPPRKTRVGGRKQPTSMAARSWLECARDRSISRLRAAPPPSTALSVSPSREITATPCETVPLPLHLLRRRVSVSDRRSPGTRFPAVRPNNPPLLPGGCLLVSNTTRRSSRGFRRSGGTRARPSTARSRREPA